MTTNEIRTGAELQDGDIIEYPFAKNGRADVYGLSVDGTTVTYSLVWGEQDDRYTDGDGDDVVRHQQYQASTGDRFRLFVGTIGYGPGSVYPQPRRAQQLRIV